MDRLAEMAWNIYQKLMDVRPDSRLDRPVPIQNQKTQNATMPMQILGRVLFPRLQPWQQRRQAKTVVTVLLVGVVFAAIVGGIMFLSNAKR